MKNRQRKRMRHFDRRLKAVFRIRKNQNKQYRARKSRYAFEKPAEETPNGWTRKGWYRACKRGYWIGEIALVWRP
jgi:hypothetical protein